MNIIMNKSFIWAWAFKNIVAIIAWTALAILFNKWWIALFALLFVSGIQTKTNSYRVCDGCGKHSPYANSYNEALDKAKEAGWIHYAWKSKRHEDGSVPFGGGWFIMGFDTDEGCYTYHYELKDWDLFQCKELDKGKPWDGHTSKDVRRLLSIPAADVAPVVHGRWDDSGRYTFPGGSTAVRCTECGCALTVSEFRLNNWNYCPVCGAKMDGDAENVRSKNV